MASREVAVTTSSLSTYNCLCMTLTLRFEILSNLDHEMAMTISRYHTQS